jgi:hypothetical protein
MDGETSRAFTTEFQGIEGRHRAREAKTAGEAYSYACAPAPTECIRKEAY